MKKDYDLILSTAKQVISDYNDFTRKKQFKNCSYEEYKNKMIEKYNTFSIENSSIFEKCITGNMDINILTFMITQAKQIQNNNISNYDASVKVGEKLVDKFIKPHLDKDKNND